MIRQSKPYSRIKRKLLTESSNFFKGQINLYDSAKKLLQKGKKMNRVCHISRGSADWCYC